MSIDSLTADSEEYVAYRIANDDSLCLSYTSQPSQSQPLDSPAQSICRSLEDFNKGAYLDLHSTKDLISFLIELDVNGPLDYSETYSSDSKFIGEGGQFSVHECTQFLIPDEDFYEADTQDVVVKKPKWIINSGGNIDLTKKEHAHRVHDVVLEILALCHESLSCHRNIVNLFGWARDSAWHKAPVLIFEKALGNLEVFLQQNEPPTELIRYHFSLDIAEGLFALHQVGIAHGDLKPSNILVFRENWSENGVVEYVAKLADFGLSVDENTTNNSGKPVLRGWTPGWLAPEIEEYSKQQKAVKGDIDFRAADIYALGLVVWSVMFLAGRMPKIEVSKDAATQFLQDLASHLTTWNQESEVPRTLAKAVPKLLSVDPRKRPKDFVRELHDNSEEYAAWWYTAMPEEATQEAPNWSAGEWKHPWYFRRLDHHMQLGVHGDIIQLMEERLTPQQYLALFLGLTRMYNLSDLNDRQRFVEHILPQFYLQSAVKDFPPAQGIAARIYRHFGMKYPLAVSPEEELCWLLNATVTGSLSAATDLKIMHKEMFNTARKYFRYLGGYNQLYSHRPSNRRRKSFQKHTLDKQLNSIRSEKWHELDQFEDAPNEQPTQGTYLPENPSEVDIFHDAVRISDYDAIQKTLSIGPGVLNLQDRQGFTALYKTCMAGDHKMVKFLCERGADPTIRANVEHPTCSHWLFNFDHEHIPAIAKLLTANGVKVDTMLEREYINYHHPFVWPRGTALHWSIWARNRVAVQCLLSLGASINLRNGSDPHRLDKFSRGLGIEGFDAAVRNPKDYPDSEKHLFGLNALDFAFSVLDAGILQLLLSSANRSQFNPAAGDEEGFTPLHRISVFLMSAFDIEYDTSIFYDRDERKRLAGDCIRVWKQAGQDIDLTTRLKIHASDSIREHTPLVLSLWRQDLPVVSAFLEEEADLEARDHEGKLSAAIHTRPKGELLQLLLWYGANLNTRCNLGYTPLHNYSVGREFEPIFSLLEAGADPELRSKGFHFLAQMFHHDPYRELLRVKSYIQGEPEISESRSRYEKNLIECIRKVIDIARSKQPGVQASVLLQDLDGSNGSALYFAANSGLLSVTEDLLRVGLSPHQARMLFLEDEGSEGWASETPLSLAKARREEFFKKHIEDSKISKSELKFMLSQWDGCIEIMQTKS